MEIKTEFWGTAKDGKKIYKYYVTNGSGAQVVLTSLGASIVSVLVPDKDGKLRDVSLGFDTPEDYYNDGAYLGRVPGRYANRIAKGHFELNGKEYNLAINNGPNHLHGGPTGFSYQVWDSRIIDGAVEFMYISEDGEEGYPGTLKAVAHYEWGDDNALKLTLTAQTDQDTVVNLTNHAYFNLDGEGSGSIEDHMLKLNCSEYLPTDAGLIPLGEPATVAGTPLDFVTAKKVGRDLHADCPALAVAKGYDHCFVIDGYMPGQLQTAAELCSEKSGIALEVVTTQPGLQVYTGNWLGGAKGKNGHIYEDYNGIALECQHFPDSPNEPEYPSTVLKPGETYQEAIIFQFSVKK